MKYYCVKQHDITDCGAACLATICKQKGYKIGINKIREIAGTDKQGTNIYGLIKASEALGFEAKGVKGDKETFFSKFPLPCIAHVIVDGELQHYVVVHKITRNKIVLADPGVGIVRLSREEFFGQGVSKKKNVKYQWSGVLLLVSPKETFSKGNEIKNIWGRFFKLLFPQMKLMINVFVASLLYTVFGIVGAFYFKELIDTVLPGGLESTLMAFSIGVILLNIFRVILNAFRTHLMIYLGQKVRHIIAFGILQSFDGITNEFFGTRRVGEIISRFNDAGRVRDAISGAALTLMIDTLIAIVGAIMLYIQNTKLFGIAVCMVLLYAVIVMSFNRSYDVSA